MKKIKPLAVISSVIIVIGIIFIARFNSIFSLSEGEIKIYDEPYAPAADVSKLAVADDTIAVFYEDAGYAGFYSLDGSFMFGVRVDSAEAEISGLWTDAGLYIQKTIISTYLTVKTL